MLERLYHSWDLLKGHTPGERFQNYYNYRRKNSGNLFSRIALLGLGALTFFIGLFFLLTPAPGIITVCIGAALLAQESLWMARLLDGLELTLRRRSGFSLEFWQNSSSTVRLLVTLFTLALSTAVMIATFRWF